MSGTTLQNAEFFRDEETGHYYARLEYEVINEKGTFKLTIPKLELGIPLKDPTFSSVDSSLSIQMCTTKDYHTLHMDDKRHEYYVEKID